MAGMGSSSSSELEKLLVWIPRQFFVVQEDEHHHSHQQPPNAAAVSSGRDLCVAFLDWNNRAVFLKKQDKKHHHQNNNNDKNRAVLELLCDPKLHPAIPQAFFQQLVDVQQQQQSTTTSASVASYHDFLSLWVLQMEQHVISEPNSSASRKALLNACIRAYAQDLVIVQSIILPQSGETAAESSESESSEVLSISIQDTWKRFALPSTRWEATRAVIDSCSTNSRDEERAVDEDDVAVLLLLYKNVLSPILASTVLAPNDFVATLEKSRILSYLHRQFVWNNNNNNNKQQKRYYLQWMLRAWDMYSQTCDTTDYAQVLLAQEWFLELLELIAVSIRTTSTVSDTEDEDSTSIFVTGMLETFLPRLLYMMDHSSGSSSMQEILYVAQDLVQNSNNNVGVGRPMTLLSTLRLATYCLSTIDFNSAAATLNVLAESQTVIANNNSTHYRRLQLQRNLLQTVASVHLHYNMPCCRDAAATLQSALLSTQGETEASLAVWRGHRAAALIELFGGGIVCNDNNVSDSTENALVEMVASIRSLDQTNFSPRQQMAALLFGMALLDEHCDTNTTTSGNDDSSSSTPFRFLKTLLSAYPHLGIPFLSIWTERLNHLVMMTTDSNNGADLMRYLEFLCDPAVLANSHCAQQVWDRIGVQWMRPHSPLTLRVALVRLFPKLVAGNKRLYNRVIECIGACLSSDNKKEPELRLAAAATLADLAENDDIRDVSDVIGWIQGMLTEDLHSSATTVGSSPMEMLLVHYAILSLHYLVVVDELDFDVVIKVLNKKLCAITNHAAIMKQPLVVIEPLVLLLGDGECGGDDDDEDDDDESKNGPSEKVVSPQVTASVQALLDIGNAIYELDYQDEISRETVRRIRENVLRSLSAYSIEALGVDEEGIKAAVLQPGNSDEDDITPHPTKKIQNRYTALRDLLIFGMRDLCESSSAVSLATKLVKYEEEILGSTLWQKRGRSRFTDRSTNQDLMDSATDTQKASSFELDSILSQSPKIQEIAQQGPSSAASIAVLLSSDGTQLSVLRDHADLSVEVNDPFHLALCVQAHLHCASRILATRPMPVDVMVAEIRSWDEERFCSDAMYLSLACLSIYMPHDLTADGLGEKTIVEDIYDIVMKAFQNGDFEKGEIAKICIGLVGVSSLGHGTKERVDEILGLLEDSIRGYGCQKSFGSYYAMALIAQSCPDYISGNRSKLASADIKKVIARVAGLILEDVVACYEDAGSTIGELVVSLKSGKGGVSPDLVDSLLALEPNSISLQTTKHKTARYLFVSCAVCLPSLAAVNKSLLLAIFRFLESLDWGSGKGFALPAVVRACQRSGAMKPELLEKVHSDYVSVFHQRFDGSKTNNTNGLEDLYFALKAIPWKLASKDSFSLPAVNRKLFDDEGRSVALVASLMSIISIACFGTGSMNALASLQDDVDGEINAVVETIFKAIAPAKNDSKFSTTGIICLGLLSSASDSLMLDERDGPTSHPLGADTVESHNASQDEESPLGIVSANDVETPVLDLAKLPSPHEDTVLAGVGDSIEAFSRMMVSDDLNGFSLSIILKCLETISIPEKYAEAFLAHIIMKQLTREAALSLLCSQISQRRRAYSAGRAFVSLATQICIAPGGWLGHSSAQLFFVKQLDAFGSKLPGEKVIECLNGLWDKCFRCQDELRCELIGAFLESISRLLANSAVSAKAMALIRDFTCGKLLEDVSNLPMATILTRSVSSKSILGHYADCWKEMTSSSSSTHDDFNLFLSDEVSAENFASQSFRALLNLELVRLNYFGDSSKDASVDALSRSVSWLSKALLSLSGQDCDIDDALRRVACAFACTIKMDTSASKRDRLATIFEVHLLTNANSCRSTLEWLAVVMAAWCQGEEESKGDLSLGFLCVVDLDAVLALPKAPLEQAFGVILQDFPANLAAFSRHEKLSSMVSNILHRVYQLWSELEVDEKTLKVVWRSIISVQRGTGNESFTSLATSILQDDMD